MSEENVERIRAAYDAYNRLDFATCIAFFHPDAEWHSYLGALEGSVHRGRDAIVEMWSNLAEGFGGGLQVELLEVIDCGGDQVVVVVEGSGTGSESGVEVRNRWAQLVTFRDGLVLRIESFPDRSSAVEAAGRSCQGMSQEGVEKLKAVYASWARGASRPASPSSLRASR